MIFGVEPPLKQSPRLAHPWLRQIARLPWHFPYRVAMGFLLFKRGLRKPDPQIEPSLPFSSARNTEWELYTRAAESFHWQTFTASTYGGDEDTLRDAPPVAATGPIADSLERTSP